jgi:uncharacterized protein (DUF2342 family)
VCCHQAGPTGYGLARELVKRRVGCVVAAPSKIPRALGDRVKTDRRDAELLVRLLLAGKLHQVRLPERALAYAPWSSERNAVVHSTAELAGDGRAEKALDICVVQYGRTTGL